MLRLHNTNASFLGTGSPYHAKKSLADCCILTTSGHSHLLLKITTITVRFQKELRLLSLEIPEPDATTYQNLVRQKPVLTRSYATKYRPLHVRRSRGLSHKVLSLRTSSWPLIRSAAPGWDRAMLHAAPEWRQLPARPE